MLRALTLIVASFLLASCGEDKTSESWGIEMENALTEPQLEKIDDALLAAESFIVDPSRNPHAKYYTAAFGTDTNTRKTYLDDRVNFLAAPFQGLEDQVGAINPSFPLWMAELRGELAGVSFNGKPIHPESTRLGLIVLGPYFVASDSRTVNLGILIHEGRHSDCPGGLTATDVSAIRNASDAEFQEFDIPLENERCGYTHSICDASVGPELEGLAACDNLKWGAYAIEALHSASLANACANCSAQELEEARIMAIDSGSRVANLRQLFTGDELPDMSSAGLQ
jgi:hypothetical protein